MDNKISIIIPVYNVEKYLHRCIDSVINQEYKNLEIILVDDGSSDKSPQICDEYAQKDNRIKVIHKLNGGPSEARNEGLKLATGEYITFIDSDDYLYDNFSKCCKDLELDKDLDVVAYGKAKDKFGKLHLSISAWMKFFKRDFLNKHKINFITGIYHEDVVFALEILINAERIKIYDEEFYCYDMTNPNSITRKINETRVLKRIYDLFGSLEEINAKYNGILEQKKFKVFLSRTYYHVIVLTMFIQDKDKLNEVIDIIKKNKRFFKYPQTFRDWLFKIYWNIFGIKSLCVILRRMKKKQ